MEKEKFKTGEVIGWFLGGFVGGFIGLVLDGGLGFVLLSVIGALVGIAIGEGGIYNVKIFLIIDIQKSYVFLREVCLDFS